MNDKSVRQHLVRFLTEPQAHVTLSEAVDGFPIDQAGVRPAGCPHSAWELLEHIRITQDDILRFSGGMDAVPRLTGSRELPKGYTPLSWPDDYWPESQAPSEISEWNRSVAAIESDTAAFIRMIEDPERDLFTPFPWGEGQTLLREAMLIGDHSAYHVGQLMLVRRIIESAA